MTDTLNAAAVKYICISQAALEIEVQSHSDLRTTYMVRRDPFHHRNTSAVLDFSCTCGDYQYRPHHECKHITQVRMDGLYCGWEGELSPSDRLVCPECGSAVVPASAFSWAQMNGLPVRHAHPQAPVSAETEQVVEAAASLHARVLGFWDEMPATFPSNVVSELLAEGFDLVLIIPPQQIEQSKSLRCSLSARSKLVDSVTLTDRSLALVIRL